MNASQLRPASDFAQMLGVKSVLYGGPGTGKTPLILTAPNPVLCATEPGLLSIRNANIPVWGAPTYKLAEEFVDWIVGSHEARQFQTASIDSVSQLAEAQLDVELALNKDGRKAYGEMARKVMKLFNKLYFAPNLHIILIAKQGNIEVDNIPFYGPYFPGKELHVKVPHLFDLIMRVRYMTHTDGKQYRVFDTQQSGNFVARDRVGKLQPVELADWGQVISKCMK